MRLFSNIRSIVLDAIAFARNLCRSRSALAAENLFLRKQLTFFVERKQLSVAGRLAIDGETQLKQSPGKPGAVHAMGITVTRVTCLPLSGSPCPDTILRR